MAQCWNITDVQLGLNTFADKYRATGDFLQSSISAVKALNKAGIPINKAEFDLIVRDNFTDIVTRNGQARDFENPAISKKIAKINKLLGSGVRLKGKRIAGEVSIEAQEKLNRIYNAVNGIDTDIPLFEQFIVEAIQEGKNYQDATLLDDAIQSLTEIVTDGVSQLELQLEAEQKRRNSEVKSVASDVSRLTREQQEVRDLADEIYQGKSDDVDRLVGLVKDRFGKDINVDNFETNKDIAYAASILIDGVAKHPLGKSMFNSFSKAWGSFLNFTFRDTTSIVSLISRRGDSVTEKLIVDRLRRSDHTIKGETDSQLNLLSKMILDVKGKKMPKFKGDKATVKESAFLLEELKDLAIQSAVKIENTGIVLPGGIPFTTTKGELMQLYVDALDTRVAEAMENAGITLSDLDQLVNKHLSDEDKKIAFAIMEFYQEQYAKENEVYKDMYATSMPRNANYGGQVSYQADAREDTKLTADGLGNRKKVNASLSNAIERTGSTKKLRLDRNIFTNAVNRINNSAKFIGGAKAYRDLNYILDKDSLVADELEKANLLNFRAELKKRVDVQFGFDNYGPSYKVLNVLKGGLTRTALALKPKLALNQASSSVNWIIEDSTWNGIRQGRHEDLQGVNISKMLYEISPWLKDRYKDTNIIALDAQIEAASYEAETIFGNLETGKIKRRLIKGNHWLSKLDMFTTMAGDRVGIMSLGVQYFKGEYNKARENGLSHEEALDEAQFQFSKKAALTQQSYASIDRAPIQQSLLSLFTMFQTTPLQYGRITINSARELSRAATGKEYKRSIAKNIGNIFVYHYLAGFMYSFVQQGLPQLILGTWDEEDLEKHITDGLLGPYATSIFFIGDIVEFFYNWYTGAVFETEVGKSAAFQNVNKALRKFKQLMKLVAKKRLTSKEEDKRDELIWDIGTHLAALRGLAIKRYSEIGSVVSNVVQGKGSLEDLLLAAGWSEWQIEQAQKKEQKSTSKFKTQGGFKSKGGFKKKGGFKN